jgi:uncharacterized membrane protein
MSAQQEDVPVKEPSVRQRRLAVVKKILRLVYGVGFIAAGISHFVIPDHYINTIPPYLPAHEALNYLAGAAATLLGALLLWPATTRFAAWGIIAFLLAVFPSNIHMAMHPELYPQIPELSLWLRLPLQTCLVTMAYWLSRR